ncbi:hypothetical protein DSM112329_04226 [Paraconexibacter sp. AEG42_29]|uniref:Mce/MlaD domain-containing protein n=1 Tax=Paraconexibacter sp. AEG42_29 TaxID=2997339 RepID=A0AAU7B039_9ACTN
MRRASRHHRRTDTEAPTRVAIRGLLVGAALIAALYLAMSLFNGVPGRGYGHVDVSFKDAGNIKKHDGVRIRGVRVGQVETTDVDDAGRVVVSLQLEPGLAIPSDTKVAVRANGLLGARFIDLSPGKASDDVSGGGTLRAGDDALTFGVPDALDTFDKETRGALAVAVGGLGQGLLGRGTQVNQTVEDVAREIPGAIAFLDTQLTAPAANRALVPSLRSGVDALDASRNELAALLAPTDRALQPFIDRREPLQRTLTDAPSSLVALGAATREGRPLLAALRALSVSAEKTLAGAPAGLRQARALLKEAPASLGPAGMLLRAVDPTVPEVLKTTGALKPVLTPLRAGLDSAIPTVVTLGRYGCDLKSWTTGWRSMTSWGGTGSGPAGPAAAFRLLLIPPSPAELLGTSDQSSGLTYKDPYAAPCSYPSTTHLNLVPTTKARNR